MRASIAALPSIPKISWPCGERTEVTASWSTISVGVEVLKRLGLAQSHGRETTLTIPEALRVQIASTGLTGTKYLQLDFFDARDTPPPPTLPFPVPEKYIPATPSTMKNLEDAVVKAIDSLPRLTDDLGHVLATVNQMLEGVQNRDVKSEVEARGVGEHGECGVAHRSEVLQVVPRRGQPLDERGRRRHAGPPNIVQVVVREIAPVGATIGHKEQQDRGRNRGEAHKAPFYRPDRLRPVVPGAQLRAERSALSRTALRLLFWLMGYSICKYGRHPS